MIANVQQYPLHTEQERLGHPEFCPVTGRQFWGVASHPELGPLATYGGPFDTYTIPKLLSKPGEEEEWEVWRYDQDGERWECEGFL